MQRNRKFLTIALVAFLLPSYGHACETSQIEPLATSFFSAAFSLNCEKELKELKADAGWLAECRKLSEDPRRVFYIELYRRTTIKFKNIIRKEGKSSALVELEGPSQGLLQIKLSNASVKGNCIIREVWPAQVSSEKNVCGEEFWQSIPIEKSEGGLPISCKNGSWIIRYFE